MRIGVTITSHTRMSGMPNYRVYFDWYDPAPHVDNAFKVSAKNPSRALNMLRQQLKLNFDDHVASYMVINLSTGEVEADAIH